MKHLFSDNGPQAVQDHDPERTESNELLARRGDEGRQLQAKQSC